MELAVGNLSSTMRAILAAFFALLPVVPATLTAERSSARRLVLQHITVVDATGAPPSPDMSVVIADGKIESIEKAGAKPAAPQDRMIDASGKFVIPGLWDMHVHVLRTGREEKYLDRFVASGVLGIRDMGSPLSELPNINRWRKATDESRLTGPRIMAAGPILDGPLPMFPDISLAISGEIEGRRAVDMLKEQGADFVKVYSLLPRECYFSIADEANKLALPFAGHVPDSVSAAEASDAGQKSIEHLSGILLACSNAEAEIRQQLINARRSNDPSVRYEALRRAQARMWKTYDEKKADSLFARLARNGTWQVPTLAVTWMLMAPQADQLSSGFEGATLPGSQKQFERGKEPCLGDSSGEYFALAQGAQKVFDLVAAMHRAGVEFMAGTDAPSIFVTPGAGLHQELQLLVKAGFTPMEALQAATLNPARYLGLLETSGTVEVGKAADLVLLDANPLDHISNTQKVFAVIVHGKLILESELEEPIAANEIKSGLFTPGLDMFGGFGFRPRHGRYLVMGGPH